MLNAIFGNIVTAVLHTFYFEIRTEDYAEYKNYLKN